MFCDAPATRLRWSVYSALRNPDQRRLLGALARRPEVGRVERRRLQQAMQWMPGARFNAALGALTSGGFVVRNGSWLKLEPDVRRLLNGSGFGVSRTIRSRAVLGWSPATTTKMAKLYGRRR